MTLGEIFLLRKWRMVPRHNISTILVESVFGGILWGKEFSQGPTTVVGTVPGGPFLMSRMAPRTPQEPPKGGRFDSPSLWNPSPTDQGRGTAVPLPLDSSPDCSDDGQAACDLHSVAGLRARTPGFSWGEPFFGPSKNRPQATSKVHFKGKCDSRNPLSLFQGS